MLGLIIDTVVQISSAYRLRVPVGKMHTDRYVPLNPQLLDDWLRHRLEGLRSNLLSDDQPCCDYSSRPPNYHRTLTALGGQPPISRVNNGPGLYS